MSKFLDFARNVWAGNKNPDDGRLSLKGLGKTQIVTPTVIGMTLAQATNALVSAGLELGTVTLTTGPVTAQSTAVYTNVNRGAIINITLTS